MIMSVNIPNTNNRISIVKLLSIILFISASLVFSCCIIETVAVLPLNKKLRVYASVEFKTDCIAVVVLTPFREDDREVA